MSIDVPNASAVQDVAIDELQNFVAFGHRSGRQILEQFKDRRPAMQTSAGNLTDHKRMHDDGRSFEQINKPWIATSKVVDTSVWTRIKLNAPVACAALPSMWAGYHPTGQDVWRFRVR